MRKDREIMEKHREYTQARLIRVGKMVTELRASETLLSDFLAHPAEVAKRYGLQFTDDEVTKLKEVASVKIDESLSETALSAVSGGEDFATYDNNCNCGSGGTSGW
jgi:hypothetical protein